MDKKYTKTRLLALLCVFILVFSLVMSGCASIKKITKKSTEDTGLDDVIHIGNGDGTEQGTSQIVVGEDGKSYLVDSGGNSVVYDATSAYIKTTAPNGGSSTKNTTNRTTASTTKTTKKTTEPTTETVSEVYNKVDARRKFGFNKYYDSFAGLANFYLDTIRVYFTYNNKDWLIEFWKGEYAMAAVGCEIGYYYREHDSMVDTWGADWLLYAAVDDEDAMKTSMTLWQYKKPTDATPALIFNYGERECWWAAKFETGVLYRHSDRTSLVMKGSVTFPTTAMRDLFCEALEKKGFEEGSTSSYEIFEKYSVNDKTVTVMWKNFKED